MAGLGVFKVPCIKFFLILTLTRLIQARLLCLPSSPVLNEKGVNIFMDKKRLK